MKDTWYSVGVWGDGRLERDGEIAWSLQAAIKYAKEFKAQHKVDCFVFDAESG